MSIDPDGNGMSSPEASRISAATPPRIMAPRPTSSLGSGSIAITRPALIRRNAEEAMPMPAPVNDDRPTHAPVQKSTHRLELG